MTFGQKIIFKRKQKNWTQAELAAAIGTIRDLIGKYERDEIKPSIDVAARIASALDCSLDYLVRDITQLSEINSTILPEQITALLTEIEQLTREDVDHVLAVISAFIAKTKLKSIK